MPSGPERTVTGSKGTTEKANPKEGNPTGRRREVELGLLIHEHGEEKT